MAGRPLPFPRLGTHHFAYLRAVAEGIGVVEGARKYLGITHGAEAVTAHRLVVDQVRAVARRRGDPRWRLIGIEIRSRVTSSPLTPSLYEWADAEGLDGWSEAELQALYEERFGATDSDARRRQIRNTRLRDQRLHLLRELEALAGDRPASTDLLQGWLPSPLADVLAMAGTNTLGELQARIARGGRWWSGLPAFGPGKAARLAAHVAILLGDLPPRWPVTLCAMETASLSGAKGSNRLTEARSMIDASDDQGAVRAWISARAGSSYTAKQYEREAERFILWIVMVRRKALSDATAEDCRAYMDFLKNIPDQWISRAKAARMQPGWAPFRGQLTLASQKLAITALHSLFCWLVEARYLGSNPWALVNRKLGDDRQLFDEATSRAFSPAAWAALLSHLDNAAPSASVSRLRWLLCFVECTGLRAAELLQARREHLSRTPEGWILRVHGKGRRNRIVPVPARALNETSRYLATRGLDLESMPGSAPLLSALTDGMSPLTYPALHETLTRFIRRALADAADEVRGEAIKASAHWLRHTHATRAAERNVPLDVLQENLGQTDPRTTARYYRAQIKRRQTEMDRAFGEQSEQKR